MYNKYIIKYGMLFLYTSTAIFYSPGRVRRGLLEGKANRPAVKNFCTTCLINCNAMKSYGAVEV